MRGCKFICNDSSLIANEVAGLAKHYAFYILQLLPIVLLYLVQLLGYLVLLLFLIADPTKTAINATGDDWLSTTAIDTRIVHRPNAIFTSEVNRGLTLFRFKQVGDFQASSDEHWSMESLVGHLILFIFRIELGRGKFACARDCIGYI